MKWRPIKEYEPRMGCVLVWLWWPGYSRSSRSRLMNGKWMLAYAMPITDGPTVWVTAHDSVPIETTGRRITHFAEKQAPEVEA